MIIKTNNTELETLTEKELVVIEDKDMKTQGYVHKAIVKELEERLAKEATRIANKHKREAVSICDIEKACNEMLDNMIRAGYYSHRSRTVNISEEIKDNLIYMRVRHDLDYEWSYREDLTMMIHLNHKVICNNKKANELMFLNELSRVFRYELLEYFLLTMIKKCTFEYAFSKKLRDMAHTVIYYKDTLYKEFLGMICNKK